MSLVSIFKMSTVAKGIGVKANLEKQTQGVCVRLCQVQCLNMLLNLMTPDDKHATSLHFACWF